MSEIKIECGSCGGTGLYCGMCEPKGEAVVCLDCVGRGWYMVGGKQFTGRKKKHGVKRIRFRHSKLFIMGSSIQSMTYKEFEKKIKP